MITIIRQNQRWLLLIVAILTIIAFGWLYTADPTDIGSNQVATIYGKTLFQVDVEREVKTYQLAMALGMIPLVADLTTTATSEDEALSDFVFNLYVLRHEAKNLWVNPTDRQIAEAIRNLPAFQTAGNFDRTKYSDFLQTQLAPRGLTELHLQNMVRDFLRLIRVRELVVSPVLVHPGEVEDAFRGFQKSDLTVASFLREAHAVEVDPPDEAAVQAFFDANQAQFVAPEERVVVAAEFAPGEAEAGLEGRELVEAMQKLADRVTEFYDAAEQGKGNDFAALAKEAGASVTTSQPFSLGGPADLPPDVASAAFRLSAEQPVSQILQEGSRFYVLHLKEVKEPRPLELAEVREQIATVLQARNEEEAFRNKVQEAETALREKLDAGLSLDEAAAATGWNVQSHQGLLPASSTPDDLTSFAMAGITLNEGEISSLERAPWGAFLVRLDSRAAPDPALVRERSEEARASIEQNKSSLLFAEWLRHAREQSNLRILNRGS